MSDVADSGGTANGRTPATLKTRLLQRHPWLRGYFLMSPTMAVMLAMLIVPVVALFLRSFWTQHVFEIDTTFTLRNYISIFEPSDKTTYWFGIPFPLKNPVYLILLLKSIAMSLVVTIVVLMIAYPMAYFMAFRVTKRKMLWLILITIPIWTSYLLRVFAWKIMLGFNGVINSGLMKLGLIDAPLEFLLYNPVAVIISPFCRFMSASRKSTAHCWKRRPISVTNPGNGSGTSPCRCQRPAPLRQRFSSLSRRSAIT